MRLTMVVSSALAAFFCIGAAARVRTSLGESTARRELRDAVAKAAARWEQSCAAVYDLGTCVARAQRIASDPAAAQRTFSQALA